MSATQAATTAVLTDQLRAVAMATDRLYAIAATTPGAPLGCEWSGPTAMAYSFTRDGIVTLFAQAQGELADAARQLTVASVSCSV